MTPHEFVFFVKGLVVGKYDDTAMKLRGALDEVDMSSQIVNAPCSWTSDKVEVTCGKSERAEM